MSLISHAASLSLAAAVFFGSLNPGGDGCCGSHDDEETATGPSDAVYEGTANDEALSELEGIAAPEDASRAPSLSTPAAGAKIPVAPAAAFEWKASPTAMLPGRPRAPYATSAPFGPMRKAHAHGNPMNGKAYLLVLRDGAGANVVRVFTTNTKYVPDAATWEKLKAAKQLSAVFTGASYDNNKVVQGTVFKSPSVPFSVE